MVSKFCSPYLSCPLKTSQQYTDANYILGYGVSGLALSSWTSNIMATVGPCRQLGKIAWTLLHIIDPLTQNTSGNHSHKILVQHFVLHTVDCATCKWLDVTFTEQNTSVRPMPSPRSFLTSLVAGRRKNTFTRPKTPCRDTWYFSVLEYRCFATVLGWYFITQEGGS